MSTRLTPYERRRLASIELRLSADDPGLAEALRTFRPPPEPAGRDRPVRTFVADLLAGAAALPSAMRAELTRAAAAAIGLCAVVLVATRRLVSPRRRAPRSA